MPVSLTEDTSIKIKLNCCFKKMQKSIIKWLLFLGQLVHYSMADITWMLKAKQSSEIPLYPMLQLFINN